CGGSRCRLRTTSGADVNPHIARRPVSGPGSVAVRTRHTVKPFARASLDGKGAIRMRTRDWRFGLDHELSDEHWRAECDGGYHAIRDCVFVLSGAGLPAHPAQGSGTAP